MPRKKQEPKKKKEQKIPDAYIAGAGTVVEEQITETLEKNYMPYAMSVIVSRAFPEIDGFKPSHRKILYTMYKMGLLNGPRTKSANIVGQTMKLNPHGDMAIYETMVRLARGNETLLHPYVDSKGNFGKAYSRDMSFAASRYTEAKLAPICNELFGDIDKDTVDFVPNYDNEMLEPVLLPAAFPSILVNSNVGIGVSMASSVCSFNLQEICETTIALMKHPDYNIIDTLKGPDFAGGGLMLYDEQTLDEIYRTGRGSVKLRAKCEYDKKTNSISVTEIPATTTVEAIIEKIIAQVKAGKLKEVSYVRDDTDLDGLTITIDLKKGTDPEKVLQKLYKLTPLQDSYSCNFNILVHGYPKVMGVYEILDEWIKFRIDCVRRRTIFELAKKKERLHLLEGLEKILLDIDKAIKIVRETEEEALVVPNLMIGFGIDEVQAEYVAEIKLRHLNREYILKRTKDIDELNQEISKLEDIAGSDRKIKSVISSELKEIIKKYSQPRRTQFFYQSDIVEPDLEDEIADFNCTLFLTDSGYFKKILPNSLRMASDQKVKDGDFVSQRIETSNRSELLFFTTGANCYKTKVSAFGETKASAMGDYVPAKLSFDEDESIVTMVNTTDYSGYMIFVYANGKVAKVPLNAYETKTNRKKLTGALSLKAKIVAAIHVLDNEEIILRSSNNRALIFDTALLLPKSTRSTVGVSVMSLKSKAEVVSAEIISHETADGIRKYRCKNIPSTGSPAKDLPDPEQLSL
ncbi:MAG: DNA topoisomerase (ATP-hydrolyzing) subunit A [Ruminococcus sp.]|nr:DNA topoisomerase (ATP-hydrolyzing) subunit A [Ruminococcus sp.]